MDYHFKLNLRALTFSVFMILVIVVLSLPLTMATPIMLTEVDVCAYFPCMILNIPIKPFEYALAQGDQEDGDELIDTDTDEDDGEEPTDTITDEEDDGGDGGGEDAGGSTGEEVPDYPSPENCVNDEDDDGDGDIDEEDSDCETVGEDGESGTPSGSTAGSCPGNILTYKNPLRGIQIQYPDCWRLEEVDSNAGDNINEIVQFYPSSGYSNVIDVGIDNSAESGLTLDSYFQSIINSYRDSYGGINIEESQTQATLGGHPAYRLVFSSADGTVKIMETGTIIGDKVYYVSYITEPSKYSVYLPDALGMIRSLTLNR